jgi:hypothetical protein
MISLKQIVLFVSLFKGLLMTAQVEVFRNNIDTSTYIAPEDTITRAPIFEGGDQDFLGLLKPDLICEPMPKV